MDKEFTLGHGLDVGERRRTLHVLVSSLGLVLEEDLVLGNALADYKVAGRRVGH